MPHVRKLLIANRGEIARRICATASDLGVTTVAVCTRDEREPVHVRDADEIVVLPGDGAAAYLDAGALVDAARRAGADAVHPGYGFLAENAGFARAVIDAGLVWVGPPAEAIARMGDKIEAKRAAVDAGVPVLESMAHDAVEFPALVKAAAGGGGKGMRVVRRAGELDEAIAAAQREAARSFGDETIFIEPYLERIRHVEIQVLGDGHGNLMHLFERECSIQRRHQKVVEEAPSTAVDPELRERMGGAAVSLARAIGYRNAGTVEFLLAGDGRFFFLEMNTRLQVEHPVTEEITGVDLVEQQLLDAAGERLTAELPGAPLGHAIEVRINAEDPSNDFLPETGTLVDWRPAFDLVRVESGVERGSVVTTAFDPLIAKFISSAPSRDEAALRLALALERSSIAGVQTNRDVLVAILRAAEFLSGDTTTDFLERVQLPTRAELAGDERDAVLAALVLDAERRERSSARMLTTFPSGWRNSRMPPQRRIFEMDGEELTVSYRRDRDGTLFVDTGSGERRVEDGEDHIGIEDRLYRVEIHRSGDGTSSVFKWSRGNGVAVERSPFPSSELEEVSGSLHAPMPGSVVSVAVAVGDAVRKGQTLVVLEAMKMEHPIGSPEDGVVTEINVTAGEQVERGALLVVVDGESRS